MKTSTLALLGALAAAPLLGAVLVTNLTAQDVPAPEAAGTAPDRAATEAIIREYLLANPDVIVEALERWRDLQDLAAQTQAEDAALAALPVLLSGETGFAMGAGADEAEVLVAEFFDYHCGYCRRATDFVFALAEEDGVRVVLQDLPILREESRGAALAGLAAAETGDYPAMHRQLMRASGVLDEDAVAKAARRADADGVRTRLEDDEARARLEARLLASVDMARSMGLDGTPTFVVASPDGRYLRVIPSYDPEAVEAAVIEARRG